MQLGFIGLGKMGGNMVLRLVVGSSDGSVKGTHKVVGFAKDPNPDLANTPNFQLVDSLDKMLAALAPPRVVWVMVPAGDATEGVIADLAKRMSDGDIIVDGGNSYFKDSIRRGEGLATRKIGFVDVGTSGGVWGRQEGYCMMVGGSEAHVAICKPLFDTLAPKDGWAHMGPSGCGHFVKMIHNGIEYGLMQAYAEGFEVMFKSKFPLDLEKIANVWSHGSVIRSWLLDLAVDAFKKEHDLKNIQPYVVDSGEGRWTIMAAMEADAPVPVISAALFARFASRDPFNFAARFNAALRNEFGGHQIKRVESPSLASSGEVKK
jgi:6-phosphogluconate dehydrogenase